MKRFLGFILSLALVLGAAAAFAEESDQLARILESGEIIVATEGAWAPWTYHDESDALVGFDVEVAREISQKLGVTARFVESEWDGIFAGLDVGRYDIAANGVEVTGERAEKYDFSTPYGYIRTALVVRGDNEEITRFEDLAGKRTANSIASTYMALAERYGAEAVGVDTLDQTIEMVLSGRCDATLNAEVSVYDYLRVHPEKNIKIVALTEEASRVSIPVRKGEEALLAAIDQAIGELASEGKLGRISQKYFGSDITRTDVDIMAENTLPGNGGTMLKENIYIYAHARDQALAITPESNAAVDALREMLTQGPLTMEMRDYGNFEKIGSIGASLPAGDQQTSTVPGDVVLYQGNQISIFYDSNAWSYTRLGHIEGATRESLLDALGDGDVTVTFSLKP